MNTGEQMQHVGERMARSLPWLEVAAERTQPVVAKLVGSRPWLGDLLDGTWFGAPLHPALTDVTVGSWTAGFVLDRVATATRADGVSAAADGALAVGVASALPTAMTGAGDWRVLLGEQRRIALLHGMLNSTALTLNVASLVCRRTGRRGIGRALSALGFGIAATSAHVGGELSFGMGIRVNQTFSEKGPTDFASVGSEAEFKDQGLHKVSVKGNDVLIARSESGDLCAISDTCSHLGGPLDEGSRHGDVVVCPWHGSRFDLCSGRVVQGPAVYDQPRFETRVKDGQVQVRRSSGQRDQQARMGTRESDNGSKKGEQMATQEHPPSFDHDIRPLFRSKDVDSMKQAFDLSSYEDVRGNADKIYKALADGSMPCDGAWPSENVQRFRAWMDAGCPRI